MLSSSWGFSKRGGSGLSQQWQQRHDPQLSVMVVLDRDSTSQMAATWVLMLLCSLKSDANFKSLIKNSYLSSNRFLYLGCDWSLTTK